MQRRNLKSNLWIAYKVALKSLSPAGVLLFQQDSHPASGTGWSRFSVEERSSRTELQQQAPCTPDFPRQSRFQLLNSVVRPGVQFRLRKRPPTPETKQYCWPRGHLGEGREQRCLLVRQKSWRQDTRSDFIWGNSLTAFSKNHGTFLKIIFIELPPFT